MIISPDTLCNLIIYSYLCSKLAESTKTNISNKNVYEECD